MIPQGNTGFEILTALASSKTSTDGKFTNTFDAAQKKFRLDGNRSNTINTKNNNITLNSVVA